MDQTNLFLLPYAGAWASVFRDWKKALPQWINPIPLTPPGHGVALDQPPLTDWPSLTDHILCEAIPYLERPFGIFGHSMGALVGIELAHAIHSLHGKTPVWFCASGSTAPSRRKPDSKWVDCSDLELVEELRTLGGTPTQVLANKELLNLILPSIRADFQLCGTYVPRQRRPLPSPLLVLGGTKDEISETPENLSDWSLETIESFRIEMIEAEHFFVDTHRDTVIQFVVEGLSEAMQAAAPVPIRA
jgi:surfactin synthase thioesterase subunit